MKKIYSLLILSFFGFICFSYAQAQETSEFIFDENIVVESISEGEGQEVFQEFIQKELETSAPDTTTEVIDAIILSQKNNIFDIEFSLTNGKGIQSDVRYSIRLVDGVTNDFYFATLDEKVYPEIVSLGENASIRKQITYTAPEFLSGEYTLSIFASNSSGRLLSLNTVGEGKVTLTSTQPYVFIDSASCKLRVKEDPTNNYTLHQGLDVSKEETMLVICSLQNNSEKDLILTPDFKTFKRNTFGELIDVSQISKESFALKAGETKELSITVPKADVPQAYDTKLSLLNESTIPSNEITIHYVVQGSSATISNFLVDKKAYTSGDSAKTELLLAGSADSFFGSRAGVLMGEKEKTMVSILFTNEEGLACSENVNVDLGTTNKTRILTDVPIARDCPSYQVQVKITGDGGRILDEKNYSFLNIQESGIDDLRENLADTKEGRFNKEMVFLILLGATLLISIVIIFVFLSKKKMRSKGNTLTPLLFLGIALSVFPLFPESVEGASKDVEYGICITYPVNNLSYDVVNCNSYHTEGWERRGEGNIWLCPSGPGTFPCHVQKC